MIQIVGKLKPDVPTEYIRELEDLHAGICQVEELFPGSTRRWQRGLFSLIVLYGDLTEVLAELQSDPNIEYADADQPRFFAESGS